MRTTTLLIAAAIGAAGAATSVAQVYSVNAVGYVNTTFKKNAQIVANPLDAGAGNNTVGKLLGTGFPDGTFVYKYTPATGFASNGFDFGAWANPDMVLEPGTGVFVVLPSTAADVNVTFVGEVPLGPASNMALSPGLQLVGSKVPQAGKLTADLKFPAADGDFVYTWDYANQTYKSYGYDFGAWSEDPPVAVAEGFWAQKVAAAAWDRNFSIATP